MAGILGQKEKITTTKKTQNKSILGSTKKNISEKSILKSANMPNVNTLPLMLKQPTTSGIQDTVNQILAKSTPTKETKPVYKLGSLDALKAIKEYFTQPKEQLQQQQQEFAQTPLGAVGYGLTDAATLGLNQLLTGQRGKELYGAAKEAQPIPYTVGQAAGYLLPGTAATKVTQPLTKLATKKIGSILGKKVVEGAITGTALETAESLIKGKKPEEAIKSIGAGIIIGAAADTALYGLGKLGGSILKKIVSNVKLNNTELKAVKELPTEAQKEIVTNISNKLDNPILQNIRKDLGLETPITKEIPEQSKILKHEPIINPENKKLFELNNEKILQKQISDAHNPYTESKIIPVPNDIKNSDGIILYRRDLENSIMDPNKKPQGLYFSWSIDRNNIITPHYNAGNKDFWEVANFKKPLEVDNIQIKHFRFGNEEGYGSAGIAAIKKLEPENFKKYLTYNKNQVSELLNSINPKIDTNKFYDSYEILEAYGGELARGKGYDSIILKDKEFPSLNEVAVLDKNVLKSSENIKLDLNLQLEKGKLRKFPETAIKSNITSNDLKKLIKENPQKYNPTTDALRTKAAKNIIDINPEAALKMVTEGNKFDNSIESFIGIELVPKLENEGRIEDALNVIESIARKGTKAGQEVQSMRAWSKLTPQGMVSWTDKILSKSGIKADNKFKEEILKQMNVINSMDIDTMKQNLINAGLKANRVEALGLDKIKEYNIALVQKSVVDKIPVSLGRKLSTYQAISHLLNPRTILRNVFGNTSFAIAEQFSKIYGIPIDMMASLKTGKRTISLPKFTESFKNGLKQAQFAGDEITLGIELGEKGKYELFRGETFKQPILNKLEKTLSRTLKIPDEAYKGYVKADSMYQMLRSRLGKQVDNWDIDMLMKNATVQEIEQASNEAKYATFQDNSWIAQVLQGTKELANKIPLGKISGKQIPGSVLKSSREFGIGDLIVKYTRVPGNIISRGLEYSPLGALKAIKLASEIGDNSSLQREFALTVGRILNGTTLMGLAYILSKKGLIISSDKTQNQAAKKLESAEGLGNNKINISAITRILNNGDDKPQKGDKLVDINWIQPLNVALSVGNNLYTQNKKDGRVTIADLGTDVMENAIDLPSLYTIQSMFYEGMNEGPNKILRVASIPLRDSIGGFVPSVVRQTAQTIDTTYRRTPGKGLAGILQRTQTNIPVLSRQLEPTITPIGTEATRAQAPLLRSLNLIFPGQISEYTPINYKEKLTQLGQKIENVNYPTYQLTKKITIGKNKIELTDKEQTEFQKIRGQVTDKLYERILQNIDVNSLSDQQAKELNNILNKVKDQAYELAKQEFIRSHKNKQ